MEKMKVLVTTAGMERSNYISLFLWGNTTIKAPNINIYLNHFISKPAQWGAKSGGIPFSNGAT